MAESAPAVSGGVEADETAAAMDVDEPVDEEAQAKVVRELLDDMFASSLRGSSRAHPRHCRAAVSCVICLLRMFMSDE